MLVKCVFFARSLLAVGFRHEYWHLVFCVLSMEHAATLTVHRILSWGQNDSDNIAERLVYSLLKEVDCQTNLTCGPLYAG